MTDILILSENELLHQKVLKAVSNDWACSIFSSKESLEIAMTLRHCALLIVDLGHRELLNLNHMAQLTSAAACPAIAFSTDVSEAGRIAAYEIGIDEVLSMTSTVDLLKAKIHMLLRKQSAELSATKVAFGDYLLDTERHQVFYRDLSVALSRKELDILLLLIQANGIPLSVHDIVEKAWPGQITYHDAVAVYIQRLRKKLNFGHGSPAVIENIHGLGYAIHNQTAHTR